MLRRSLGRLCAAGSGASSETAGRWIAPEGPEYVPLARACSIFGYDMSDRFEKKEIKKRFAKLALRLHPDHGGTEEAFQELVKAHRTLLALRHDKGGTEGRFNVKNMNFRDHKYNRDPKARDAPPEESTSDFTGVNVVACVVFLSTITFVYLSRAQKETMRLIASRGRLREEEVKPLKGGADSERSWHPWSASPQLREQMKEVEAIVSGVRTELRAEERGLGAFAVRRDGGGGEDNAGSAALAAAAAATTTGAVTC